MPLHTLDQLHVRNAAVREQLTRRNTADAAAVASAAAAEAMSDLGTVQLVQGRTEQAIALLKSAIDLNPACHAAFHNLVKVELATGSLRGPRLDAVKSHLLHHWRTTPWAPEYEGLLYAPKFLNLEFVKGKCNLKCRMCIGTNAVNHPDRLSYLGAADFRRMLENAPTIAGVTLSSGDSDPLLHPDFDDIIAAARDHRILINLYTNGLPLSARTARAMVDSGVVSSINFSIDAATAGTYQKVRGGDFEKMLAKIRMLAEMKHERGADLPRISVSFVAMADTVQELPDFITLAAGLSAKTVIVDDLSGWLDGAGGNHPAADHPQAGELLLESHRRAAAAGIDLQLHEGLRQLMQSGAADQQQSFAENAPVAAPPKMLAHYMGMVQTSNPSAGARLACCGWIDGVWVNSDGSLHPCCMVRNAADMGKIQDGPLLENAKYEKAKSLLATGKVFEACRNQRMCQYVQEQASAGIPLRILSTQELGDIAPRASRSIDADTFALTPTSDSLSLPVLQGA